MRPPLIVSHQAGLVSCESAHNDILCHLQCQAQ